MATPSLYAEYLSRVPEEVGTVAVERLFKLYPHRVPHLGEMLELLDITHREMYPLRFLEEETSIIPATAEEVRAIMGDWRARLGVDHVATSVEDVEL